MEGWKSRRALITSFIVLIGLLVIIGSVAWTKSASTNHSTSKTSTPTKTAPAQKQAVQSAQTPSPSSASNLPVANSSPNSSIDPSTVNTIDVPPMNLTVSYVKGIGGFAYQVQNTGDGRQYVEFSSSDLIGTKCTDDSGVFISIIESPNDNESATVTTTQTVDGVPYGLSVASSTCTSNPDLLKQYQDAFVNAFSLLKKTN